MAKRNWNRDEFSGEPLSFLSKHVDELYLTDEGGINPAVVPDCNTADVRTIAHYMRYDWRYCREKIEEDQYGILDVFRRIPIEHEGPDGWSVESGCLFATHTNTAIWAGNEIRSRARLRAKR